MFVRVDNPVSPIHGCVFEVVDNPMYIGNYQLQGVDGRTFYVNKDHCQEITDEEASAIVLADQICYKDASSLLPLGTRVRFTVDGGTKIDGRVSSYGRGAYWCYDSHSMVGITFRNRYYVDSTFRRFDKLEIVEDRPEDHPNENGELPVGFDFFTFEPIYEGDDYHDLYNGERAYEDAIGLVLEDNIGDGWNICEDCGRAVIDFENDEYITVCRACYDDNYCRCEDCGDIVRTEELYEVDDCWYCENCASNHSSRHDDFLHSYGYKPDPVFRDVTANGDVDVWGTISVPKDKLFMGVELEIDGGRSRDDCLGELAEENGDEDLFYCKEDASLNENGSGIEIVTHPCTLQYHIDDFPWEQICDIAKRNGFRSHDTTTCGMHVHVSRCALGADDDQRDLTVAKMMLLMDKFWKKLVVFSRRDKSQLHWTKKPNAGISRRDSNANAIRKSKRKNDGSHEARYYALNITNANTVEFRLFRGTLNRNTIMANLQLVSNIVRLAKERDLLGVQDATWEDLVKIQEYPELTAYLATKGLNDFTTEPLGDIQETNAIDAGDTVLCSMDRENPFPAEVTEIIQPGVFVIRNNAADDDYRIAFTDELQLNT